ATLAGSDTNDSVRIARDEVLKWARKKTIGLLPSQAWEHSSFEHLSGGRNCSAVRLTTEQEDIWSIRVEDPDKTVAGRIWTSEIAVVHKLGELGKFTLRLLVGSPELFLRLEPHVPGVVRQIVRSPGLLTGSIRLTDRPVPTRSERDTNLLIGALLDPGRKL